MTRVNSKPTLVKAGKGGSAKPEPFAGKPKKPMPTPLDKSVSARSPSAVGVNEGKQEPAAVGASKPARPTLSRPGANAEGRAVLPLEPTKQAASKTPPVPPALAESARKGSKGISASASAPLAAPAVSPSRAKPSQSVSDAKHVGVAPSSSSAKGSSAKGSSAKGSSAKGSSAKGSSAKGSSAKGDTRATLRPIEQAVGVSSDAVARRTGKSWAEWFALLDAAGAAELDHKGIVAVLAQRHGVGPWWQQMVTVAYEQARGKREHHEAEDGYRVGVSKTLELPLAKLFRLWSEPSERNKWLADDRFSIHKATASKSIRARWGRGASRIDVDFCEKGPSKSQVTVEHNRIESPDAAEQMKAYWAKKISALEALLSRP